MSETLGFAAGLWDSFEDNAYLVVSLSVLFQNVGVPLPAQVAVLGAAYLCWQGQLSLPALLGMVTLAGVLGALVGYLVGVRWGRVLVTRWGPKVGLTAPRLARLEGFYARHGVWAVAAGRFVAASRTLGALVAGMAALPMRRFMAATTLGALLWTGALVGGGYALGSGFERLDDWLGWIGLGTLALVLLLGLGWWLLRGRQRRAAGRSST